MGCKFSFRLFCVEVGGWSVRKWIGKRADDGIGYEFPTPHCRTSWDESHFGPDGTIDNGTWMKWEG
jgi:hypothetical protein